MKIIVTHASPDLDAISSVWAIKRFLQGWDTATVKYVPAGERLGKSAEVASENSSQKQPHLLDDARQSFPKSSKFPRSLSERLNSSLDSKKSGSAFSSSENGLPSASVPRSAIEQIGKDEVIHVDTGLGPLDHHQTQSDAVCAASVTWEYIKKTFAQHNEDLREEKIEAVDRMMKVVVDVDHFKEVFWENPTADHYEFNLVGILDGLKIMKPDQNDYYTQFVMEALDGILHEFENRIWAEKEIKENGKIFETRSGRGVGFETINDTVIKLAQKMGYVLVVRKDPRKGYVRIKTLPKTDKVDADLTLVCEQFKKMDPDATWFLHIGKKMLLNGTTKNPKMKPTKLSLTEIIKVLEKI